MKLSLLSDTHGARQHSKIVVPPCDVLCHSGDIGGRTSLLELHEFLQWFAIQPAERKIFIGGNHDIVLDENEATKARRAGNMYSWSIQLDANRQAKTLIQSYEKEGVIYLQDKEYVYNGVKFYGSPYSPWFHGDFWAFNKQRGAEINKVWAKIPSDVDVLLSHTPPYGVLDDVFEQKTENELDSHAGCKDLLNVIKKRLTKLKLHTFGHIHANTGLLLQPLSQTRNAWFANACLLNNQYNILNKNALTISI